MTSPSELCAQMSTHSTSPSSLRPYPIYLGQQQITAHCARFFTCLQYLFGEHTNSPLIFSSRHSLIASLSILMQVAVDLLKQYKEKFQGGTLTVTWNYLRESMGVYLSQPNPVTTRWEGESHLRDPSFQLDAFRVRVFSSFSIQS